jgi:predicted unusual protein kinase regulating ubiquinone biosynthesis (AarF/ABC1/UbiB family)
MSGPRKLPSGRLGRFARLAGLGARTGVSLLTSKSTEGAAAHAAEVLGTMRGIAAKVGQMASYVDGVVPDEHREAFERSLRVLRAAAPSSSPEAIRGVVEQDLGAPIEELFGVWHSEPFASASIGQVHEATLLDGTRVAVKVQHPGIQRAVESDLSNASLLESMVGGLGARKFNSKGMLEEIKARFREELDYELEAERQRSFRALHEGDPSIAIPSVIDDRSSKRVLTSELVSGLTIEEAAQLPTAARRRACETLWRFVFKGNLVGGMFNADPHPGNYVFHDDGRVTFLDFGCVQPIVGERQRRAVDLHRAALRGDEAEFRAMAAILLGTRGGLYEKLALDYTRTCFEPLFSSPFRLTRDFSKSVAERLRQMKMQLIKKGMDDFVPLPEGMVFMNRLQFGFYSVLARFDVEVDYAAVERTFLREAGVEA